jgi:hypothetical protein
MFHATPREGRGHDNNDLVTGKIRREILPRKNIRWVKKKVV